MRFQSAKSRGFAALMLGIAALLAACAFIVPPAFLTYVLAGAALVIALFLWIWFGTWYEFRDGLLLLRFGPFTECIPYERVTGATAFRGMVASMALSGDMIELTHGDAFVTGTTYVSPKDKDGILRELKARRPDLKA